MVFSRGYKVHLMTSRDVCRASKDGTPYFIAFSNGYILHNVDY